MKSIIMVQDRDVVGLGLKVIGEKLEVDDDLAKQLVEQSFAVGAPEKTKKTTNVQVGDVKEL